MRDQRYGAGLATQANLARVVEASRAQFPWDARKDDMNRYSKPPALDSGVADIHLPAGLAAKEQREQEREAKRLWQAKVVVGDVAFRPHRTATDKRQGLLQDPPQRLALATYRTRDVTTSFLLQEKYDEVGKGV